MIETGFQRGQWNRIRLHVLPTKRFKTFAIALYAGIPLSESTVTPAALIPFVLRRGTASTPETKAFRERLDDMYGAGFGFDVLKRGDAQIVQFRMDVIHDQFVSSDESLLDAALAFLGEVITEPALEDGRFRSKYVDAEKKTLQKRLEAIVNDKIRYAAERCLEEMCANEPYRLHPLGWIGDLSAITPESLMEYYRSWLASATFDLYVVGDTSLEEANGFVSRSFKAPAGQPADYPVPDIRPASGEPKHVIERMEVGQGKLNMGLRANVSYADDDYPAALLYNGILGGYPHSKLFVNVREKASLAYYAASRYDGHKGIITIQSGIETGNYDKANTIIAEQLEQLRQGDIQELVLTQTQAMIRNQLLEIQDSAFEMIGFDFNSVLSGRTRTTAGLLQDVEKASVADVVRVAQRVQLDTIYFLRDEKEG
ncbi:zinc protease [Paenibacillus darwinianus]|uniref:Zinc protease n=1 Tax=Paenibacillus darwinianus TaxID=1380763 RepID=A0A9W5W7Y2_9BACL|nr:pitrilysin family protein [Paenibacillus darwinianus]EXX91173.1 zinc protease [Paenibacillus darwinianus]EXX92080.1 zinc protease [Paenibacillus darwinianus]EXX92780.1 zinc protease [Paenibacillus darwinianus]